MRPSTSGAAALSPADLFDENGNLKKFRFVSAHQHLMGLLDSQFDEDNYSLFRYKIYSEQKDENGDSVGIWNQFGYKVGWNGAGAYFRRTALMELFCSYLVPENDSQKSILHGFGKPVSRKRYDRIESFIRSQINQKKHNTRMKKAVRNWESDLNWLNNHLQVLLQRGHFELCENQDDPNVPLVERKFLEEKEIEKGTVIRFVDDPPTTSSKLSKEEIDYIISTL